MKLLQYLNGHSNLTQSNNFLFINTTFDIYKNDTVKTQKKKK